MTRKELFKRHDIAEAIGYRILESKTARRGEARPFIIEAENHFLLLMNAMLLKESKMPHFALEPTHLAVASAIGLAKGTERAIQHNMADYGVRTYMAQQKKYIKNTSMEKRNI